MDGTMALAVVVDELDAPAPAPRPRPHHVNRDRLAAERQHTQIGQRVWLAVGTVVHQRPQRGGGEDVGRGAVPEPQPWMTQRMTQRVTRRAVW